MTPAETPPEPRHYSALRWWVCGLLLLATVLNYMDRMALNQTALRIQMSLGIDDEDYSWLESIFSAAFAVGAICTGFVVDRIQVRWVYPFMVLGWSIAGILTGFASTFWALLACRCMLGLFEAGNWPCGIRTTRAVLPPAERSLGNALFQSGTALGAVITPLMMPMLLAWADPQESHRTAIMTVTGGTYALVADSPTNSWQFPFRVIGSLGVVWILLWFITIPRTMVVTQTASNSQAESEQAAATSGPRSRFVDVLRDPRYWVLFSMVIAINITWHGYRTWLPLYLQKQRGFSEQEMNGFMWKYYLAADIGSWTIGFFTLWLARAGMGVHRSRMIAYGLCAMLAIQSIAVPILPDGWVLKGVLLLLAFGALGMFPTYFALTQELSARHQGKVTGSLGFCAHGSLALIYPIEGRIVRISESYELVLAVVGLVPLFVLVLLIWVWPPRRVFPSA